MLSTAIRKDFVQIFLMRSIGPTGSLNHYYLTITLLENVKGPKCF